MIMLNTTTVAPLRLDHIQGHAKHYRFAVDAKLRRVGRAWRYLTGQMTLMDAYDLGRECQSIKGDAPDIPGILGTLIEAAEDETESLVDNIEQSLDEGDLDAHAEYKAQYRAIWEAIDAGRAWLAEHRASASVA